MQPIGKYIVITPIEEQIKSDVTGLIMSGSDAAKMRYKKAEIVRVGTEVTAVSDGQTIYYDKNAGFSMVTQAGTYTVIMERDVIVII